MANQSYLIVEWGAPPVKKKIIYVTTEKFQFVGLEKIIFFLLSLLKSGTLQNWSDPFNSFQKCLMLLSSADNGWQCLLMYTLIWASFGVPALLYLEYANVPSLMGKLTIVWIVWEVYLQMKLTLF